MSSGFTCPRCNCRLRRTDDGDSPRVTCPRCLASVRRPATPEDQQAFFDPNTPILNVLPASPGRLCPECGDRTEPDWRSCPHCGRFLRPGGRPRRRQPLPEADAARDDSAVRFGLLGLGALLVLGVMLYVATGGVERLLQTRNAATLFLVGTTVLTVLVGGLLTMGDSTGSSVARWMMRGLGFAIGVVGMVCLTLAAIAVAFLNVCNFR
jgi:hypothetical protein